MAGASDELLMERIKGGSAAAFEELARRWEARLFRLARGFLRNDEDALDARQEILVRVYKNAGRFRASGNFSAWVHRVATNACMDIARRRQKEARVKTAARVNGEDDPVASPLEYSAATEREGMVRSALSRLPEREKAVVSMYQFEGLTLREIARALDVPLSTASSRFYSALKRLKRYLEPLMKEET